MCHTFAPSHTFTHTYARMHAQPHSQAGIKAVGYIAILLFLVFYIFAVAGMIAFRENDPFHFRSIPVTLVTLFRAATMEDWTDIMYISIYGCDKFPSGIYYLEDEYKGTANQGTRHTHTHAQIHARLARLPTLTFMSPPHTPPPP